MENKVMTKEEFLNDKELKGNLSKFSKKPATRKEANKYLSRLQADEERKLSDLLKDLEQKRQLSATLHRSEQEVG